MTLRSQTLALVVLFAGLVVVFVLVGSGSLDTDVFTSQPTATAAATALPTAVPVEELWAEQQPGQLSYLPDPAAQAILLYDTMPLATAAQQLRVTAPAADAAFPLLGVLGEVRSSLEDQAAAQNIALRDDGLIGPYVQEINGVGVAFFRASVDPQTLAGGGEFAGLDREWALVQRPDGDVVLVLYGIQSKANPTIYADYRAWLAANVAELAAPAASTATPEATAEGAATPQAATEGETTATPTVATGGEAAPPTEQPAPPASSTPTAAPAEEATPTALAAVPTEAVPPAAEPQEIGAETQGVATAAPSAAPAEGQAAAAEQAAAAQQGPWNAIGPGQLRYDDSANAFIFYNVAPLESFVAQSGAEPLAEDDPAPLITLLRFMQGEIEEQLTERGITFGPESFEGPETQTYGGVPVNFMWIVIEPQTVAEGQSVEGQELAIALIDRGDDTLAVVEFVYTGAHDETLAQAVRDWLDANAARLADPTQPLDELTPTPAQGPAPAATPAADATVEAPGAGD